MTWQQTYTGVKFSLADPQADSVRLEDIAHALSNLCRWGGHTKVFYSVAEHCVRAKEIAGEKDPLTQLYVTMHDFTEAYVIDVPRPLKLMLTCYKDIENRIAAAIAEHFGVEWPPPKEIKRVIHTCDEIMLATEARDLLLGGPQHWLPDHMPLVKTISPWSPQVAEQTLLRETKLLLERIK